METLALLPESNHPLKWGQEQESWKMTLKMMHVAAPDPLSCSKRLLAAALISSKNKVCIQKNARWYFFCSISSSIWFHGHPYWGKQYWSEHSFRKIKTKRSFYSVVDVNCSSRLKTSCLNYYVILGTAVESSQCSIKTIVFQLIHKPNGKPGFKLKAPSIFRASSQFEREETFLD